jgi:hypothetical protein
MTDDTSSRPGRDAPGCAVRANAVVVALAVGLVLAPLWLAGVAWLLLARAPGAHRVLGIMFLATFGVFLMIAGKNYDVAPAYPVVFAAGAVPFEGFTAVRAPWIGHASAVRVVMSVLVRAPLAMQRKPLRKRVCDSPRKSFLVLFFKKELLF